MRRASERDLVIQASGLRVRLYGAIHPDDYGFPCVNCVGNPLVMAAAAVNMVTSCGSNDEHR